MKLFTDALDVREIDSSDWFRFFFIFSWLVVVFVFLFKMPLSSGFVNELLAVSIGLEDFRDVLLLLFTFCVVGDDISARLNNAVMTLCFDLVE